MNLSTPERNNPMSDGPNFAAWTNENLAKFAREAYARMLLQQEEIEHLKLDAKAALEAARKAMVDGSK
jgi:hypothetical protein